MVGLVANIDVPDADAAARFYGEALGLRAGRRLDGGIVELLGAPVALYLLPRPERDYARHWCPVHFDFVVEDINAACRSAELAGARCERPAAREPFGWIAQFADPFGHGFCLIEFTEGGYDAVVA